MRIAARSPGRSSAGPRRLAQRDAALRRRRCARASSCPARVARTGARGRGARRGRSHASTRISSRSRTAPCPAKSTSCRGRSARSAGRSSSSTGVTRISPGSPASVAAPDHSSRVRGCPVRVRSFAAAEESEGTHAGARPCRPTRGAWRPRRRPPCHRSPAPASASRTSAWPPTVAGTAAPSAPSRGASSKTSFSAERLPIPGTSASVSRSAARTAAPICVGAQDRQAGERHLRVRRPDTRSAARTGRGRGSLGKP